ncbi:MAG TPA: hypothetical protein VHN36_15235 [Ilumatobacteraceae bacterium]|nr:hypothetical protein [Ilumatobacteraceae bacterium]
MDDSWLERGHGSEPSHLDTIFTSAAGNRPASVGHLSDVTEHSSGSGPRTTRRSSRLVIVTALWFGIIVGTSGAAWAVRDALFPSIGPAEVSVWQNPGHDTQPPPNDDENNTTTASTTATTVAATPTEVSTATSVEPHESNDAPNNSTTAESDGGGTKHGDSTPTTVVPGTPSSVDDHGGGHGGSNPGDGADDGSGSGKGKGSDSGGGSGSGGDSGSGGGSGG